MSDFLSCQNCESEIDLIECNNCSLLTCKKCTITCEICKRIYCIYCADDICWIEERKKFCQMLEGVLHVTNTPPSQGAFFKSSYLFHVCCHRPLP